MSVLVIAEHDNLKLKTFSLNAINATSKIDSDIHVLVAGQNQFYEWIYTGSEFPMPLDSRSKP